jgi:hypothetical protein
VLRLVFLLAGALLVLNGAKALGFVDNVCREQCDDDDASGHCPPGCEDCSCCSHLPSALSVIGLRVTSAPPHPSPRFVDTDDMPPSADPREFLHVPRSTCA